jgi:hypothetical protein
MVNFGFIQGYVLISQGIARLHHKLQFPDVEEIALIKQRFFGGGTLNDQNITYTLGDENYLTVLFLA